MEKFLIVGLGVFGKNLALKLMNSNVEVVAIDTSMELIEEIQNDVTYSICLDSTDEKALNTLGLNEIDVAVVCIGEDFESMLLTSVLLKNGGVKKVVTRASNPIHIKILKAVGIDEIITPELEVAEKLAYRLIYKKISDVIYMDDTVSVAKIKAPESFIGKSLGDLNLRAKYGINVIAIDHVSNQSDNQDTGFFKLKSKKPVSSNPGAETIVNEDDVLIIIGAINDLKQFSN